MTQSQKFLVLIGISLFSFTGYLDATIVSTALTSIQKSLHMSVTELQWIMNAFFLGLSACMASMGRVADLLGRRKIFYVGVFVFGIASIGAGLSTTGGWLIFFRAIQGVSTAITLPVGVTLVHIIFDDKSVGKAMGVFSMMTGAGLALGPIVGGILVTAFGWPSVFFVNIPFILVGLCFCLPFLAESKSDDPELTLDYFGILFLTLMIVGFVFSIVEGGILGWSSAPIVAGFVVSAISLVCLIFAERRNRHPIIKGSLFKDRGFLPIFLNAILGGGVMIVFLFAAPLYLNIILDQSHFMTGVYLFVISVIVVVLSPIFGGLINRVGVKNLLILEALLYIVSCVLGLFFPVNLSIFYIIMTFAIFGTAWALVNTIPAVAVSQTLEPRFLSVGFGIVYSTYNIGASIVLAIVISIFHITSYHALVAQFKGLVQVVSQSDRALLLQYINQPNQLEMVLHKLQSVHAAVSADMFKEAFMCGMHSMFWPVLVFSIIVLLSLFMMPKRADKASGRV